MRNFLKLFMITLMLSFGLLYYNFDYGEYKIIPEILTKISNDKLILTNGEIKISKNIILLIIFTIFITYTIFSLDSKLEEEKTKKDLNLIENLNLKEIKTDSSKSIKKIEFDLLIIMILLGLIIMLISDELFLLYLGLELFTFGTYFLILTKQTSTVRRLSILYLILSSIASILMLYSFSSLYYSNFYPYSDFAIWGVILAFLFKLGSAPFLFWVVRLYSDLDKKILWFLITIPKVILVILLLKFINLFSYHTTLFTSSTNYNFPLFFFSIIAFICIFFGSIGGLFQKRDNNLLAYSSILNIGFILLLIGKLFMTHFDSLSNIVNLDKFNLILLGNIVNQNKILVLFQFILIYLINIIGVFAALSLFKRSSNLSVFKGFFLQPWFFFCFIINIISLIGLPPFAGFYGKLYFSISILQDFNNTFNTFNLFYVVIALILSSFLYFKFLFPSSSDSPSSTPLDLAYVSTNSNINILITNKPNSAIYILASTTILSIIYPFIVVFILPFLQFFYN